jgi:calpain-15
MGLISEHAYSVISAMEVNTPEGPEDKERLLKLRNPWGHKEWQGRWSDNSDTWTDELKKKVGCEEKNDGVFFMCVEDYLSYFRTTVICKLHEDYVSKSVRCNHKTGGCNLIKVNIKKSGKMFFTVSQLNQRWVRRNEEYEPSFVRMLLSRICTEDEDNTDEFPLQYVEGK